MMEVLISKDCRYVKNLNSFFFLHVEKWGDVLQVTLESRKNSFEIKSER